MVALLSVIVILHYNKTIIVRYSVTYINIVRIFYLMAGTRI